MRKTLAMASLWIATAAVVAGGATTALAAADGRPGAKVLTQSQVQKRLADGPSQSAGTIQPAAGKETSLVTEAGTVIVRCHHDKVTGYRSVLNPGWTPTFRLGPVGIEPTQAGTPSVAKKSGLLIDLRHPDQLDYRLHVACLGDTANMLARSLIER